MKTFATKILNSHFATKLSFLLILIFICISTFFAIRIKPGIFPDEAEHLSVSLAYSTTWGIPSDTPETYSYGYLGHKPFLFYWINGRVINLLSLFAPLVIDLHQELIILRLLNVFYSTIAVFFFYLLSKEVLNNKLWQLFGVFLLTNTMMFVFLSGGLSYDNLTNLCCFAGIYFWVRVLNGKSFFTNSIAWLACICFGMLVKITVIPLAGVLGIIWLLFIINHRRQIFFQFKLNLRMIGLIGVLLGLVVLNFLIYGMNIINFRELTPACNKVLTEEICEKSWRIARDNEISLPETISYKEIITDNQPVANFPDPIAWILDFWVVRILKMTFGIFAHKMYWPSNFIITFYRLFLFLTFFVVIRYWKKPSITIGSLSLVLFSYIALLIIYNYNDELIYGFKHIAIHGRYLFPVIGVFYILIAYLFSKIPNAFFRSGILIYTLILFSWGSPLVTLFSSSPVYLPTEYIPPEQPIGEIVGETEISQEFISKCVGTIDQIEIHYATYSRTNTHDVTFQLTDSTGAVLEKQTISASLLLDNSWYTYNISNLYDSLNKEYRITITSPESVSGDSITIWSSKTDVIADGQAIKNGERIDSDLLFRYQCLQPALTDWIYY